MFHLDSIVVVFSEIFVEIEDRHHVHQFIVEIDQEEVVAQAMSIEIDVFRILMIVLLAMKQKKIITVILHRIFNKTILHHQDFHQNIKFNNRILRIFNQLMQINHNIKIMIIK